MQGVVRREWLSPCQGLQRRSGVWVAPVGQNDKRSSAVLHSLALATASAALLRLAAKRFSSCCTRQYKVVGVLECQSGCNRQAKPSTAGRHAKHMIHPTLRLLGVARSLLMYYGVPMRAARLRRFYAKFIAPGSVCFDVGAHVGSRVRAWRSLGAQVVAVEPQVDCQRILHAFYGRDKGVIILDAALGAREGKAKLLVSERTPTLTTLSREWTREVQREPGFRRVAWRTADVVPVTTLQLLIKNYGLPAFVKIDVEGYEAEVLRGLDSVLPCLSFEYLPAARAVALECVQLLTDLGNYRYNWSVGESHRLVRCDWCDANEICRFIENLPLRAGSGDIYARLDAEA